MSHTLRHEDYTVAWIAVLPIEAEAALAVLDKIHDGQFETGYNDDYTYIGGEINGHNVVLAKLPSGQNYGVGSAAAVANHIKTRFDNIRFALLVGVAAGLPNLSTINTSRQRDIRLGDVLVCVPNKLSSGIVQYDLGTDVGAGLQPSGRQAETPALVRSAINDIQVLQKHPFRTGNTLALNLEEIQNATTDNMFDYPGQDKDDLYEPADLLENCGVDGWLLIRSPREESELSHIWYGNIGSGSTLMRNVYKRDQLRDSHDLIGLEMEAAGVMNTIPTGVVRGVCDYGDAYKAKQWQPYAAAVAAVYAKAILHKITPRKIKPPSVRTLQTFPFRRNVDVVQRKDLDDALELLLPARTVYQSAALWGLGGSGKTQIALEFAYRRHANDHFHIFWVHADSYDKFLDGYQQIATAICLGRDLRGEKMLTEVRQWLEGNPRWLLVLDNADDISLFTPSSRDTARESSTKLHHFIPQRNIWVYPVDNARP